MSLQVYSTLTKQKERFTPVRPGHVGIYLCGPTVYKPSHIGHVIGPIIFDTIKRYLVHKGFKVTFVINITDVDDKLIAEADQQGVSMAEVAERVTAGYMEALDALNVRSVDEFPKATENMGRIIDLISKLIEKEAAYVADGEVYFDHTRSAGYGKLSGRNVDESLSGTRAVDSRARHSADFALWKAAKPGEPSWNSPWGQGRPGWHIECSAMSMAILGETFDIHGGGLDLVFPHHENEIAQSETATGKPYARYWMHNGLTRIRTKAGGEWRDEKMSKSLGNVRGIAELIEQFGGETIRAFVLSTHYRRPLDFSDDQLVATAKALSGFYRLFQRIKRITGEDVYDAGQVMERIQDEVETEPQAQFAREVMASRVSFYEAMDDDFNTAEAMAVLHKLAGLVNRHIDAHHLEASAPPAESTLLAAAGRSLVSLARLLGLFEAPPVVRTESGLEHDLMSLLIDVRERARRHKQFDLADQIRDGLAKIGVVLEDTPAGAVWRRES